MTSKKTTKNALIVSVLSIMLCVSMLIGSTFAWFTDTDTAVTSNIVAGTLDIEIVDTTGAKLDTLNFVNVNGDTNILWEPGATFKTVDFQFKNFGTLALKYKVELNNTEVSYNKLNSAIKFTLVKADGTELDLDKMVDLELAGGASSEVMCIKGVMSADAGNEYQGLTLAGVSLTVYAAQKNSESDMTGPDYDKDATYDDEVITVGTPDEFIAAFAAIENDQIVTLTADIDMTGEAWTPVDNKSFVLNGNGHTITGLNGGLSDHTGATSITVKNVTFAGLVDNSATNYAGLIADADTCSYILMENVTITGANISSAKYAAGFAGYTSGYGADYDGPVNASHNFVNCTLINSSVVGGGSVGALIGHAGGNKATTTTINGVVAKGNKIVGEDTEHTGVILGTSHVGEVVLNYDAANVQAGPAVGRFVPNESGKLTINGVEQVAFASADKVPVVEIVNDQTQLNDVIANVTDEAATVALPSGTFTMPTQLAGKDVTFVGTKDTVIDTTNVAASTADANITFDGVTVQFPSKNYSGFTHSDKVVYKDCTLLGLQSLYAPEVEFVNCTFENKDEYCLWTYGATNVTFTGCTFNSAGRCVYVYNEVTDGDFAATISFDKCVFNDDNTMKEDNGVDDLQKGAVETGSNGKNGEHANKYTLIFTDCETNGFQPNNSNGSKLWGNKHSLDTNHLSVTIDNVKVY